MQLMYVLHGTVLHGSQMKTQRRGNWCVGVVMHCEGMLCYDTAVINWTRAVQIPTPSCVTSVMRIFRGEDGE